LKERKKERERDREKEKKEKERKKEREKERERKRKRKKKKKEKKALFLGKSKPLQVKGILLHSNPTAQRKKPLTPFPQFDAQKPGVHCPPG